MKCTFCNEIYQQSIQLPVYKIDDLLRAFSLSGKAQNFGIVSKLDKALYGSSTFYDWDLHYGCIECGARIVVSINERGPSTFDRYEIRTGYFSSFLSKWKKTRGVWGL